MLVLISCVRISEQGLCLKNHSAYFMLFAKARMQRMQKEVKRVSNTYIIIQANLFTSTNINVRFIYEVTQITQVRAIKKSCKNLRLVYAFAQNRTPVARLLGYSA